MSSLRHLASNGRTIVSTIHQPRSSIFALFDQLCLLSEGRVMYFGPATDAVSYFAGLDFHSPPHFNPADFFLDLLSIDPRSPEREVSTKARVKFLGDKYDQQNPSDVSYELSSQDIEKGTAHVPGGVEGPNSNDAPDPVAFKDSDYQSRWLSEFLVLCNRAVKLAFRERQSNVARLGQVLFFAVLLGLIWLRNASENDESSQKSIPGIIFFIVINQGFGGAFSVIFGFPLERSVVTRERAANTYRTSSYFLSKTFTDIPKTLFFNTLFSCILYWMVGLRATAGAFFFFILIIFLVSFASESLALAVSILAGDAQTAAALIPVFIIMSLLFGGFFISADGFDAWLGWLRYLSFVFYAYYALLLNQYPGNPDDPETGYVDLVRNTIKSHPFSRWGDVGFLIAILIFFRILGYIFLNFLRGPKYLKF